jgi:branched-chain amino acid transport system ATP-binding protein
VSLLKVSDLNVSILGSSIIKGISFDVPEGGVTALLGRNGVGKTTTLKAILGLVPRHGEVTYSGRRIDGLETHEIIKTGIAYVPEDRDVFSGLTVEENFRLAERAESLNYDRIYSLFPELKDRAQQRAGTLSGGQQQMVSIARAMLNGDPLMLIDEPSKGLAPKLVSEVAMSLDAAAEVATVLLVEQNLAMVKRIARHVVILDTGQVVYEGDPGILHDDATMQRLLGVGSAEVA